MFHIYILILLSSVAFGIGEFIKSLQVSVLNPWSLKLYTIMYTLIFILIYLFLFDKDILNNLVKDYMSLTLPMNLSIIVVSLLISVIASQTISFAFRENSKLKHPINVGILSSVLSLTFIITILCNIGYNIYMKKPINIDISEIVGCLCITLGVIIIILFKPKNNNIKK